MKLLGLDSAVNCKNADLATNSYTGSTRDGGQVCLPSTLGSDRRLLHQLQRKRRRATSSTTLDGDAGDNVYGGGSLTEDMAVLDF